MHPSNGVPVINNLKIIQLQTLWRDIFQNVLPAQIIAIYGCSLENQAENNFIRFLNEYGMIKCVSKKIGLELYLWLHFNFMTRKPIQMVQITYFDSMKTSQPKIIRFEIFSLKWSKKFMMQVMFIFWRFLLDSSNLYLM